MLYAWHESNQMAARPLKALTDAVRLSLDNPFLAASPFQFARAFAAGAEVLHDIMRARGKPAWGLQPRTPEGRAFEVQEQVMLHRPFCNLVRFVPDHDRPRLPKVMVVAPMSGHYATLLRGTVEALVADHDVYVTDWADAKMVPYEFGRFDLDSYIEYLMEFMRHLGADSHAIGVCQPAPAVLAAVSLLAAEDPGAQPASMTLMGGPIDTRVAETEVTRLAQTRPLSWFERSLIATVPLYYPGRFRRVYPGFLQLSAFIAMNPARHMDAHYHQFQHLVRGDGDKAEAHRTFYDEYLAVMDVTAEYYLQTVHTVFQQHLLPTGRMLWRGVPVDPAAIDRTALFTVEGELDDISAPGQTLAAHALCVNIPQSRQQHHLQPGTGHYGIFNGSKWRNQIKPKVAEFIRKSERASLRIVRSR